MEPQNVSPEPVNRPAAVVTGTAARVWHWARSAAEPYGDLCCALFFERSLIEPLPAAPNRLNATIRLAREDDLKAVCKLYADDSWLWLGSDPDDQSAEQLYRDRLRRGERCYLAFAGDELAHVNWTCYRWGDALPGQPIKLRTAEVYTTDAFTPVAFRGRGIHALVLGQMLNDARVEGASHAYTLGQFDRPDAHKGLRALGWRETGRVVYFQRRGRPRALVLLRRGNVEPLFRR